MSMSKIMDAAPRSNAWTYDRFKQFLGGLWFFLLAILIAAGVGTSHGRSWPSLISSTCLATFYVLLALLIMTRAPAKAQAEGVLPRLAAFVGTYMPWTIAFLGKTSQASLNLASTACVLIGMIMILVTIRHLGRSFSLVPQARSVVQSGPYRWIRHPLYLSEEIATLGAVLQYLSPMTVILLVLHIAVQVVRIRYEEDLLGRTCPEYSTYASSRWRLVPYVW